jgi:hypothetical protein
MRDLTAPESPDGSEDVCQIELIQLQNLWNIHSMTEAGAGLPMPKACEWSHPKHGPMPFPPLGAPSRGSRP